MPKVGRVLETSLYVDRLDRSIDFYERLFGFEKLVADDRFCAFNVSGRQVLLLFVKGGTTEPIAIPGWIIPPHDGSGPVHIAFSIAADELAAWETQLTDAGVAIEGRTKWPRGGLSIYFRDPDGHLLELATPGLWPGY